MQCLICSMGIVASHSPVIADNLVLILRQGICNHQDDIDRLAHISQRNLAMENHYLILGDTSIIFVYGILFYELVAQVTLLFVCFSFISIDFISTIWCVNISFVSLILHHRNSQSYIKCILIILLWLHYVYYDFIILCWYRLLTSINYCAGKCTQNYYLSFFLENASKLFLIIISH